jgi:hypothetical protein
MFRGTFELRFHFPVSSRFFMPIGSGPSIENKATLQATSLDVGRPPSRPN